MSIHQLQPRITAYVNNVLLDSERWQFAYRPTMQLHYRLYPSPLTYYQASQVLAGFIHGAICPALPSND